jgi:5-methylcytosine-specific restriction protein A
MARDISTRDRSAEDKYYDKFKRDRDSKSFYNSSSWSSVREQALIRDHYLCQHCLKEKKLVSADMVHHIVPIRDDKDKAVELENLLSLCNPCHNKVHGGKEKEKVKKRAARVIQSMANREHR